jgi:hypothetical protein
MRASPMHVVFAIILVGSLVAKDRTTDVLIESSNLEPAVMRAARSHGWALRDYTTIADTDVPALVFHAAGCAQPMLVVLLSVAFDQEPVVRSAREPGYVLRYVYIGRTWDEPRRLAVFVERLKYAALAVFGLTPYVPSSHVLLVEAPPDCQVADDVDWRTVWSRDDSSARGADTEEAAR